MLNRNRLVVVLPALNAEKTLRATVQEIPDIVDEVILLDDHSLDDTAAVAKQLGLAVIEHDSNLGLRYGGNQETCYLRLLPLQHNSDDFIFDNQV